MTNRHPALGKFPFLSLFELACRGSADAVSGQPRRTHSGLDMPRRRGERPVSEAHKQDPRSKEGQERTDPDATCPPCFEGVG